MPDWFGNLNQLTYLCTQSYEKVIKTPKMELKKLKTQSLVDALKSMNVGETCIAPDECTPTYVKKACSELKEWKTQVWMPPAAKVDLTPENNLILSP